MNYTSAAGNGTISSGENTFEAYIGIPITFTITAANRRPFYTNYEQTHTFTTDGEVWNMELICAKQITVNVKDDVPGTNVQGATVTYFEQTKTTDTSGNAVFYWSGSDPRNISVSASNLESYTGQIAYNSANPFNIVMTRAANPVTLVVREITPAQTTYYQNLQIKYTAGSATGTLTTNASGAVTFNGYIGTEMTFTVVGHPEFYSNPTQKHTYTAANQSWTMDLTVTAKITINVKSNVPSGTNLSGATVSYFHQTGTTDNSGNVSLYRSSVTRNVDITATYHGNYRGSITSDTASPFNAVMTRSTATVSLGVSEVVRVTPKYMLEITTDASTTTTPGLGGFTFSTSTAANKEFVAYFRAKVPAGRQLVFASNATGDNSVRKWLTSDTGTGGWYTYAYYVRCGATGSFSTTNFFYIERGSRPITWYLEMATVFDITGSNVQNKSDAEILSKCTFDKIISNYKDFLFNEGTNGVIRYNTSSTATPTITRKAASGTDTFNFTMATYSSMKMNFSPAASTSPLTLDTNGNVSFVCYLGTPVTFTPTTRANYYSNPNTALTYTAAGQFQGIYLICNQKIVINTVANIYNTSNALAGTITYFGQTRASGGDFYRSGLDRQMTATAQYFNNYVGTVTATQTSPYTVTMNRTTRTVTLTVVEKHPSSTSTYPLGSAVIVRSVPTGSNAPAGEITLDASGKKTNTVYAGINYTYTPKNNASYYSNASQEWTWVSENQSWTMTLNVTARLTFNIKSSNYGTNISGVSGSYFGQTGTTDSSGNWIVYRSGISRSYSFSKTNYNALSGTLSSTQASPLNLKMSETSSSITITIKDYYQSAVKGNANGCPVTLTNKSLSSVTFSGTTNSSGQVSFGPMIAGSYTLSWGGGTSYWVAGSTTITMPTASTTQNAVRLTKSVGTEFRLKIPFSTPVLGYWGTANLVKPIFTTAGVATTVSLTKNNVVYYLATYTWIAGLTTTITAKLANYFVTGTTTTETPYSITPNYNFSNIGHNSDATAFYSTAIKSIVVTVQNSYTNAAVSGATINMYGINGSYQTSGEPGAGYATQTVTTNSSGQATVYVSGLTNRYVVSATRYTTLNTTNTNTSNFTIKLVPSEVTITITVNDVNTGTNVGSGCIVKLSSNNSSTTYSGTTNSSGQVVLKIKPGNYWWETGGTATWGASGTGTWNYPNRSTTSISLIKDQSITIEALKVGVWVTNRRVEQYSSYINDYYKPYKGAYTGIVNLPSEESKLYAISNSFGVVYPVYYSLSGTPYIEMVGHSVYVYASSFKYHCVSKLYKTNDVNIWDSDASSYLLYDENFLGVSVSSPKYYISGEDSVITSIYFLIDSVIYWRVNQIFRFNISVTTWSFHESSWSNTTNAISDQYKYFNNYSIRKYASVIRIIYSSRGKIYSYAIGNEGNSSFFIVRVEAYSTGYEHKYSISYLNLPGYPYSNEGRVEHMGWLVLASNNERVIILVKSQDRSYGDTYAKFYYGIWKGLVGQYGNDLVSVSSWSCHYNIPSAITSVIGGDYWVSPDLKWLFYISLNGANYQGFSKGLHTIKGSSALFGENGWTGVSYEMEGGGTDILNACQNYYILDVQFNSKSNKIMVFGNSSKGAFTESNITYGYAEGIQPDIILYFIWVENQKKFVRLNSSHIGGDTLWNDYSNSTSGGKGNIYKPLINFVNGEINFMYPGGNEPFNAYRYNLSFGE